MAGIRAIGADVAGAISTSAERGTHEVECLLQGVCVLGAAIEYVCTQAHARQQAWVTVDAVQCKKHGLQALDATMLIDGTALLCQAALLVYWEQPTQHQVPLQGQHFLCWALSYSTPQQ